MKLDDSLLAFALRKESYELLRRQGLPGLAAYLSVTELQLTAHLQDLCKVSVIVCAMSHCKKATDRLSAVL